MGVPDSLQTPMEDPPITASLGPIDRLICWLRSLERSKHTLPVGIFVNQIGKLREHLEKFRKPLKDLSEMEDTSYRAKWWMKGVRDLCYDTEDYLVQSGAADPRTFGRIARIILCWFHSKLKWRTQLSRFMARAEDLKSTREIFLDKEIEAAISLKNEISAEISLETENRADTEALQAKLVVMLAFDDHEQPHLKLVAISGFAGSGKTTLARTLYVKCKKNFHCSAFVRVSRNQDFRSLLTSILSQINAPLSRGLGGVQDLIVSIGDHLQDKRYLIVVDDVQSPSVWDIISRAFPGGNFHSRIIVTTDSEQVEAAYSGYKLKFDIFKMGATNDGCTHTTTKEKSNVLNSRYNNLPLHLKTCLLYFSMYPEGCTITKDDLAKQWVGEGFIATLKRHHTEEISEVSAEGHDERAEIVEEPAEIPQKEAEKIAQVYFDELVAREMIQPVDRNHKGKVLSCTVHHAVLDLIRYKSKEDNFIVVVDNLQSTLGHADIIRRLSVMFGCEKGKSIPENLMLSKVRSLAFHGFIECVPSIADYGLLRVLILNIFADEDKIFDLTRIGEIYQLRYLKIECNITVRLPSKIRRLQHLGTLELHAEVESIPSDIGHLKELMHVRCPSEADLRDLGKVTNLLDLQLTCSLVENLEGDMEWLHSILVKLSSLRCLALVPASVSCSVNTLPANPSRMCISSDSLCTKSPAPAHLQTLELSRRCRIFSRLPEWIGELHELCILKIAVRELSMEDVDILKGMPSLTALSLHAKTMSAKRIVFGEEGFSVLTYFKLTCTMPWLKFEACAMSNLEKLKLCFNVPLSKKCFRVPIEDKHGTAPIIIERLLGLKEISAIIGSAGVDAESAWEEAIESDPGNPTVQLMGLIYSGDQGRGMETREGSGEDENTEADIRDHMQPESSRLPVPEIGARCREDEPEHRPFISEIVSIPNQSESRDGQTGQVMIHGSQRNMLLAAEIPQAPVAFGLASRGSIPPAVNDEASGSGASQATGMPAGLSSFSSGAWPGASSSGTAQGFRPRSNQLRRIGDANVLESILDEAEDPMNMPLALFKEITDDFSEERIIGYGEFGVVYKGVLGSGIIVAVKRIHINENTIDDKLFRREFTSMMKINHQNVARFLGFCSNTHWKLKEHPGSGEKVLVNVLERLLCLEYISNGSLDKHITDELRGLEWETRYEIITGVCKGLYYLHNEKSIIHMRLKPENILLDDFMVPKITDFGLSRPNSRTMVQLIGTREYMAPEYWDERKTTPSCDIYSLGLIIIELVTGCKDVPNKHNVLRRWRHRWKKPPTQLQYQQVTRCIDIAGRCREKKPEDRPSISKIITFLGESESSYGQISPRLDEDDMLGIEPLHLYLPSELKKGVSLSIELTNDSRNFIAFNIQLPSKKYSAQPVKGIMQPKSKCGVTITVQARDVREHNHSDKFIVQSMKLSEGLRDKDTIERMFEEARQVDEVNLMVVYELTKPQSSYRNREDNIPAEEVPEATSMDVTSSFSTNMIFLWKERDRAVDLTRGPMASLLYKLGKLITEDYNLVKSIKRDIESFLEDLTIMQRDLAKLEKLDRANIWIDEVRELSYNIEDTVDNFLVHFNPHSNRIDDVIRDIKNQVQAAANRRKMYHFDVTEVLANATDKAAIEDLRNLAIYEDKEEIIGIEAPRDEVIQLFEEDRNRSKQNLKIVSIVGHGGLGKTTLAKAVYDKLQAQYGHRAFVLVGRNPDVKKVLKNINYDLNKDFNAANLDVWQLRDELLEFLKNKRYFIVIDDIWHSSDWNSIRSAFPRNKCGSRVITTTRIISVALACCNSESKYVYRIKPLSKEDSKRLFSRRTFGPQKDYPMTLNDISVDILKTCGGMPLAINSIASVLAGKGGSTWEYLWKSLGSLTEGKTAGLQHMMQILDLSYIHLPDHLKTCLLYVCMYRDDREIEKNDLLRQWVAEGFVSTVRGLDAEDVAENYFKELIDMCLIQPGKIDYNNEVLSCRVHGIILDLLRSKSTKGNFIQVIDGSEGVTRARRQIRRVSVHSSDKEDSSNLETINGSLKHVRSVLLYRTSLVPYFLTFKYVRVLHIEDDGYTMNLLDLNGINRLFLLSYLKIACFSVSAYELKLPNQIGELQQLETLDIDGGILKNYPSDIVSLPRLSYLRYGGYSGIMLPDEIDRLKSLRTLGGVCVYKSSVENIKGLGELSNLTKLHLCSSEVRQSNEETTMCMNVLHFSISRLSANLRILTFGEGPIIRTQHFHGWSSTLFPGGSHIRKLDLRCCEFQSCPEWLDGLYHLYSLSITVREVADGLNIVGGLPSLAYFYLDIITESGEQKEESVIISGGRAFKALKHLTFYCQKASLTFEVGAMPKLEKLEIEFHYHMTLQFIPIGIEHLPASTLKEICLTVAPNDIVVEGSEDWSKEDWMIYFLSEKYRGKMQQIETARSQLKKVFLKHHPDAYIELLF